MRLKVIGSGSTGNSYLLTDSKGVHLIIECGITLSTIKKAIDFDLKNVSGAIVTHGHQDHCKSIDKLAASGISIYASKGTLEETEMIDHHRANIMNPKQKYAIGDYSVMGFDIVHDTKEPFGFIINHPESGNIVFITDTVYSKFKFNNITHWIVESNYDEDIIDSKGGDKSFLRDRILESHMSIQTLEKLLSANDLSKTRTITLTHLSDRNSNQHTAKKRIQDAFSKETYIADAGLQINLNKTPF